MPSFLVLEFDPSNVFQSPLWKASLALRAQDHIGSLFYVTQTWFRVGNQTSGPIFEPDRYRELIGIDPPAGFLVVTNF